MLQLKCSKKSLHTFNSEQLLEGQLETPRVEQTRCFESLLSKKKKGGEKSMSEAQRWHQKSASIHTWLHLSKKIKPGTQDWFNHPYKRKNVMKILGAKLVSWDLFHVNNTNQTLKFSADMIWQVSQALAFTLIQLQKYFIQGKVGFKCFPCQFLILDIHHIGNLLIMLKTSAWLHRLATPRSKISLYFLLRGKT